MTLTRVSYAGDVAGTSPEGITFDYRGFPAGYAEDRAAWGRLQRCPQCRRHKPRSCYTDGAWGVGKKGQYCQACRKADTKRRRDEKRRLTAQGQGGAA